MPPLRPRFRLRSLLIMVALSALVAAYAGQARQRWVFCWERATKYALREGYYRGIGAAVGRPGYTLTASEQRKADYSRRAKWKYRWAAFRFWEPMVLIEYDFEP
jgi:hypothetical protein